MTVRSHIDEMKRHNIILESTSPYAVPVVMTTKKDRDPRLCVKYRKLNKVTVKDCLPFAANRRYDRRVERIAVLYYA